MIVVTRTNAALVNTHRNDDGSCKKVMEKRDWSHCPNSVVM